MYSTPAPQNGPYDTPTGWDILVPDTTSGNSTPEPGSLALGLCALSAALGGALRRRRRRA